MTLRLLIDINLSPMWVKVLRESGIDAAHWYQIGTANASDSELFAWARDNRYVVFTHDLDFGALLAAPHAEPPSVFQIRTDDVSPDALAPRAIDLLRRYTPPAVLGWRIDRSRRNARTHPHPASGKQPAVTL